MCMDIFSMKICRPRIHYSMKMARGLKADFLSSQKPLAASQQVLASSQNNFLSSHLDEHRPSWSFKQRQLNQAITITLRLTEYANIFLNTYPVVVFSHLSLQPLFPCTKSQQCFTTATIRSFDHFEHVELPLSLYCDVHLLAANSKLVENFQPSSEYSL